MWCFCRRGQQYRTVLAWTRPIKFVLYLHSKDAHVWNCESRLCVICLTFQSFIMLFYNARQTIVRLISVGFCRKWMKHDLSNVLLELQGYFLKNTAVTKSNVRGLSAHAKSMHTHTHTHIHIHTPTHIHIHTYTYTHTYLAPKTRCTFVRIRSSGRDVLIQFLSHNYCLPQYVRN